MTKTLAIIQGILLVLLGAALVMLGLAIYAALRGDDPSQHNNARFVGAPAEREVRLL